MNKEKCPNCRGLGVIFSNDGKEAKCQQCDDGYIVDNLKNFSQNIINCKNEVLEILNKRG